MSHLINNTCFVPVPVVLVDTMELPKSERLEWSLEDKGTLVSRKIEQLEKGDYGNNGSILIDKSQMQNYGRTGFRGQNLRYSRRELCN